MRFDLFVAHYAGDTSKDLKYDHDSSRNQKQLRIGVTELNVVAETLKDLQSAKVSTAHHFEITEDIHIYYWPRSL